MNIALEDRVEILKIPAQLHKKDPIVKYPWYLPLAQFVFQTVGRLFPSFFAKLSIKLFTTPRTRAKHKHSDRIIESAKVFDVFYDNRMMKAYSWGEGENTVLLVHGWESRGSALKAFVPILVEAGFKVVAFDGPAHGNSGGQSTHVAHFSGAINAMMNHLDNLTAIIAHSFGGLTTASYLQNNVLPQILNNLVLFATPQSPLKAVEEVSDALKLPGNVRKKFMTYFEGSLKAPISKFDITKFNLASKVRQILVVHDLNDEIVSFQSAKNIKDSQPNSRLLATKGLGHFRITRNNSVIAKVIEFVNI